MDNTITSSEIHNALYAADLLPHIFVDVAILDRRAPRVLLGAGDTSYEIIRDGDSYTVINSSGEEFGYSQASLEAAFEAVCHFLAFSELRAIEKKAEPKPVPNHIPFGKFKPGKTIEELGYNKDPEPNWSGFDTDHSGLKGVTFGFGRRHHD